MIAESNQVIVRKLLPKQMQFVRAKNRFLMYSGCFGGGKSVAICEKLVSRACVPGTREVMVRKAFNSLRKSTLKTLIEGDGDLPPILPRGSYTHNKSEAEINIYGGGQILYMGLDDHNRLGSINATGIAIDEAIETTDQDWNMLRGRIRLKVSGVPNQLYLATNPGPPSHYLAEKFGFGEKPAAMDHHAISTMATDNHHLPEAYIRDLASMEGVARRRFFLGEWAGSEGVVYERFNRNDHVREMSGPWAKSIISCDYGFNDPFVALSIRMDHHGCVYVDREIYETGLIESEMTERVQSIIDDHSVIIVDSSAAAFIESMRRKGLPVFPSVKGKGSVNNGIIQVHSLIGQNKFAVNPFCSNTINEFETYEWRKNKDGKKTDTPIDANNHAMDAIRYGVSELTNGRGVFVGEEEKPSAMTTQQQRLHRWIFDD